MHECCESIDCADHRSGSGVVDTLCTGSKSCQTGSTGIGGVLVALVRRYGRWIADRILDSFFRGEGRASSARCSVLLRSGWASFGFHPRRFAHYRAGIGCLVLTFARSHLFFRFAQFFSDSRFAPGSPNPGGRASHAHDGFTCLLRMSRRRFRALDENRPGL